MAYVLAVTFFFIYHGRISAETPIHAIRNPHKQRLMRAQAQQDRATARPFLYQFYKPY
jgi:hypothetical protein